MLHRWQGWRVLLWLLPAWLLSVYPLAVVIGANVGVVPLSTSGIVRSLAAAIGSATLLVLVLRIAQRDLGASATWVASLLLLFTFYSSVVVLIEGAGGTVDAGDPRFAVAYVAISIALATIATRPWKRQSRSPILLLVVSVVLLIASLAPGLVASVRQTATPSEQSEEEPVVDVSDTHTGLARWRASADALIQSTMSHPQVTSTQPRRDIYYIVLDGLGRPDTLREYFNADLDSFVAQLKSKGFYVPEAARTNYAQTFLSLASTLNLSYLDGLAQGLGTTSRDRRPLAHLIQENALMRMASRAGYRVVVVGSDHMSTERIARADVCICSQLGLNEVELATIALTPLAPLAGGLRYDAYETHRRKVLQTFAAIPSSATGQGPKLVFAHLLVPHPPFVFNASGEPRPQPRPATFRFQDGNHFKGSTSEYVSGYREQALFVARQLSQLVDSLLDGTQPAPVIVIHGDHGPGLKLQWERPDDTDMHERMDIFAAYHLPDDAAGLYPTMTPINGARILAKYFGVEMPLLEDMSYFSRWSRPYEFIRIPARDRQDSFSPVRIR